MIVDPRPSHRSPGQLEHPNIPPVHELSYDPDKLPSLPKEKVEEARSVGQFPILVMCEEPGARPGDPSGVCFWAFVHAVPRVGEDLLLQDRGQFQVKRVIHKVAPAPEVDDAFALFPHVVADRASVSD
jgi:hypothetical protein